MKERQMKKQNRTGRRQPIEAVHPERTAARSLPDCLLSLATARAPEKRPHGKIEPSAFSRAEMRDIVLEMIG